MRVHRWLAGLACLVVGSVCVAQKPASGDEEFSRSNGWTIFAEYSNTSSHLLMGASRQREFAALGGAYTRRIVRFRGSQLGYQAEVRPAIFESDPLQFEKVMETVSEPPPVGTQTFTSTNAMATVERCQASSGVLQIPPGGIAISGTYNITCGRQWTFAQAFSPLGFKYSMMTRRRVQPFIVGTLGYMYSSRPIPIVNAEAFNFIFDFGPGIEIYSRGRRSISLECRFQHFSNRDTAEANPGVDNLMYKLSYSFGR
jgi:hypothetical protein